MRQAPGQDSVSGRITKRAISDRDAEARVGTRPLLVHPAEWTIDEDLLDERGWLRGADTVHHQMVRWLERLGHRTDLQPDAVTSVPGSAPTADPVRCARPPVWQLAESLM